MVRVVSPPLDDAQRQVIAPALAEAAEADLAPPASNAVSRAIEDSLAGKGGVSQRTNNAARLANQVMQPVPQLSPPPFFDVQAFFATFPPEIELGVSEANPVASYDLPMYYATPYGIPLLRTDGQLGSYCRVESTQLSNGYYSVVYVDLSNARKNEAGRFEFDSIQGRLAIALPYAGFAEHSIPLTVLVNHLSETEYEQQAFYQDDELFGEEDIEDETVPEDGAVPTEDTAGQQVDENPASETPSSDPSSRIQAASYLATCVNSRIGAMGDSITEAGAREGGYLQRLQGLCQGAVFEGHGISGQGTNRMRERFASDIIARHYDYVIILGGINNIGGPVDRIKTDLQSMYDAAHEAGIRVIAVTVTPWKGWQTGPGGTDWNQERQQKTDELNEWILSRPRNVDVVADAYSALEDPQNQDAMRREYYNADHLHPNAAGHRVLGDAIYAAAFFRAPSQPLVLSRPAPQANAQTPSEQGDWFWPAEGRIGQTQGAPRAGGTRIHLGIDISGQLDSPVYAIQSGRVTKTNTITATAECEARLLACRQGDRTQCPSSSERECSNCGKQVVITEPNGRTHLYCHLNEVMVQVDQEVTPCQQIGKMGHTGNAIAGVHLHYGLFRDGRITTESSSIDPLSVFNPSTSGQSQGQSAVRGRETRDLNEAGHCGIAAPRA
ncbi:TPA: peptidoglycan DD-metalloendopeptidase family protein [Candidatus Micrarchaeota archaeon]|nr:peptidoglycan DD-metalloendopeptidase family protein [Candidatus Micrarchaeota archaeon]